MLIYMIISFPKKSTRFFSEQNIVCDERIPRFKIKREVQWFPMRKFWGNDLRGKLYIRANEEAAQRTGFKVSLSIICLL